MSRSQKRNTNARRQAVKKGAVKKPKVEDIRKLRKERRASRNYSGTIVAGIFFTVVIVYIFWALYGFANKSSIPTVAVHYGSIDSPQIIKAIIVRDERVYQSSSTGTVNYHVKDQEKVKKGTAICSIRDESALETLEKNAEQIDKNLMDLQTRRSDISEAQKEADKINSQIKDMVDKDIYHYAALEVNKLYELKDNVTQTIQIRNQILLSENNGSLREYADERSQYQEEINRHISVMYAAESGILSESLDGQEEHITFDNRDKLTKEQTTMTVKTSINKKEVEANEGVYKIVLSNEWYIAAYIDNDAIYDYEIGDTRRIYIDQGDNYTPIDVTVSQIDKGESESYVLFKSTKNILDYINRRSLLIKTSDSVITGYKIPNSAIVDRTLLRVPSDYVVEDENAVYVMKKNGELAERADIVIRDSDEENVYVLQDFSNLKIGDVLVTTQDAEKSYQLNEIVSVKGVYLVNSGIAEFRRINLEGEVTENSGYSILDPSVNKTIRDSDRIVSEAKNIQDGQVIY